VQQLLELTNVAQRFDIPLMLFILPHSLLAAMTAPPAADPPSPAAAGADGAAARLAVLAEIGAVVRACQPAEGGGAGRGKAPAMHLQAIVSALDSLHRRAEGRRGEGSCTCTRARSALTPAPA